MSKPLTFFAAVIYGVSWVVFPISILAAASAAQDGRNPGEYMAMILMSSGVILFVHARNGWFPFQRQR